MNQSSPKVSVLVPIYNVENYLEECLSSLVMQTFSDFEVICINDGSTDGSRDIVQRYIDLDSRFHVIDKPNSGYGCSMNLGLKAARGDYIAILESDDFYLPDALQLLYQAAVVNCSDVAKANFYLYWSKPEITRELFCVVDDKQANKVLNPREDISIFFRKPSIWSGLYSRSLLLDNDIAFLESPGASYQDAGFNFKVWASAQSVAFISDPVLCYRQDNESSSVSSHSKAFCVCDEYASMEGFLAKREIEKSALLYSVLERMKFDSYMWNFRRLSLPLRKSFVERISKEFVEDIVLSNRDLSLFEPGPKASLQFLISSPNEFLDARNKYLTSGMIGKLLYYLQMGGVSLLLNIVINRLFGNSVRRTDRRGACI